ncbi:uncharacterized protein LTHEOB_8095 [Lasiodiplodia theobromae]|uniref:uncharacterized protein n=1 Tax=Lasiodiplodia theobromae TaxID=45133 RepID=UPI0015C37117|nr:uncharacterized protein LTHEOB_8095 [Lasiodiplodia theobromae]KAF4541941.1 hypothetical protein LTHEOB_8095 [Lasiodiplodia theobromae]
MDPLTQSRLGSVWANVSRRDFERNVDELYNKEVVPEPNDYTGDDQTVNGDAHDPLPIDIERKLADYFAYISAYDAGVHPVTAATIEYSLGSPGITVRLAANSGVKDHVRKAIIDVLIALKECNNRASHRRKCEENIFDIVVRLNRNKIYSRLGSKHFRKPTNGYPQKKKKRVMKKKKKQSREKVNGPLSVCLKEVLRDELLKEQTLNRRRALTALADEVNEFHNAFEVLETSEDPELVEAIKKLIKEACLLPVNNLPLVNDLDQKKDSSMPRSN